MHPLLDKITRFVTAGFGLIAFFFGQGMERNIITGQDQSTIAYLALWIAHLLGVGLLYWSVFGWSDKARNKGRGRFEDHRQKIAWSYVVVGGLASTSALLLVILMAEAPEATSTSISNRLLGGVLLAVPVLVIGIAMLRTKKWAVKAARGFSFIYSVAFPVGTLLAFYTWWSTPHVSDAQIEDGGLETQLAK